MIVLEIVSYIFLGVAMMRLEPAMKIEIIISFSRCLIRANVHIYLKPKETLHFELPNISFLFLSLTLSLPMSPKCDLQWSANVAFRRLEHAVRFSIGFYRFLRHIVGNKGDNLNTRPVYGK